MRYFACAIFDANDPVPVRSVILATNELRARALARSEMARNHRAIRAEIRENGTLLGVETAAA